MKKMLSFEFWQKFGKCLMVVIAVMPAAGLMVSIGNSLPLISDAEWLALVGNIIAQIGWGIIGNLHLLFALAIGGSWAYERAGGAFAAGLLFCFFSRPPKSVLFRESSQVDCSPEVITIGNEISMFRVAAVGIHNDKITENPTDGNRSLKA